MKQYQALFLQILRAAIHGEYITESIPLSRDLLELADRQYVLPMICETVHPSVSAKGGLFIYYKKIAVDSTVLQYVKSKEILPYYSALVRNGLHPLVVKGMVCRQLYPHPEERLSVDEDILIPAGEMEQCDRLLKSMGMQPDPEAPAGSRNFEVSYYDHEKGQYLEVHTSLFDPASELFSGWNAFFSDCYVQPRKRVIYDTDIWTLPDTDHLFYLILHVLKHFLHSGFGIRQVCDICLFSCANAGSIDWERLRERCGKVHSIPFVTALFKIGCQYLLSEAQADILRSRWSMEPEQDTDALLSDILEGGITGNSSLDRLHSSSMTLQAAMGKGDMADRVLRTVFPSAKELSKRYPYLEKAPALLPAAWISRIMEYMRESRIRDKGGGNASETVRIAGERIRLLSQYGLLPENRNK